MATARDIMAASSEQLTPDASLRSAAQGLRGSSVNGLPVVAHGVVLGVVTGADLVTALASGSDQVSAVLQKVPTVEEHADIHEVRKALSDASTRMVAVIDIKGKPVGLITAEQLKALDEVLPEIHVPFTSHKVRMEDPMPHPHADPPSSSERSWRQSVHDLFWGDGKTSTVIRRFVVLVFGPLLVLFTVAALALTAAKDAGALVIPLVLSSAICTAVLAVMWFVIARHQARKH